MSAILALRDCREVALVGGKAINLAQLITAGFSVPDGFVVTTEAFAQARKTTGQFPQEVPTDLALQIANAYRALGEPIVAVRSSATAEDLAEASLAGQYETILDVQGAAAVIAAVGRCWRSIDTPRTRSYLASKNIVLEHVAMAVVVQRLVPADVAGVLFTINPRTGQQDEMLIEASWGLGEAVVSGMVQPDTLVVASATGVVREAVVADKQLWIEPGTHAQHAVPEARRRVPCLNAVQVDALRRLGLVVQAHFKTPQDLEWALHGEQLFLLQSRAITTLSANQARSTRVAQERQRLQELLAAGQGPWVRHNLSETLPQPTPLTWSVIERFMSGNGGFGALYRRLGFAPSARVATAGMLELIGGRVYADLARAPEMFFEDYPFAYDLDLLRANPDAAQDPPTLTLTGNASRGGFAAKLRLNKRLAGIERTVMSLAHDHDQRLTNEHVPALKQWVEVESARDLSLLSNAELLTLWQARERRVLYEFAPESLLPAVIVATVMGRLRAYCAEHAFDQDPAQLAALLADGGQPNLTVRATAGLHALSQQRLSLSEWLRSNGHRAPEEFDLATPRWHERAPDVEKLAAHLRTGAEPLALHTDHVEHAAAAAQRLRAQATPAQRALFDNYLSLLHRYLPWREDGKHWLMLGYEMLRSVALEAGRRLRIGDGVFLLTDSELAQALTTGYAPLALIEERRRARAIDAGMSLPAVIAADDVPSLGIPTAIIGGDHLPAFVVSPGRAHGPVRMVLTPESAGEIGTGYILVCPSTDPSWTPLFVNAAGLVLERGGALSHGAVVARELGIPAVVVDGATKVLSEGEDITVDGTGGRIHRTTSLNATAAEADASAESSSTDDVTIARTLLPPPKSAAERRAGRWRNSLLVAWSFVFAFVFLLPAERLYQPLIELLDVLLWPLVLNLGKMQTVALIAVVMAVLVVALQRFLTDNGRLQLAKQRAAALRKAAGKLPQASPRRRALLAAAMPVQWRIMGASFVPLAWLLGPMIFSVCWLMDRFERSNDVPGVELVLRAQVDGDTTAPLTMTVPPDFLLDQQTPATQSLPPIRSTLKRLAARWTAVPGPDQQLAWDIRAAATAARSATLADLNNYLAQPMPTQVLVWKLRTPATGGSYLLQLAVGNNGDTPLKIPIALGSQVPNTPREFIPTGKFQGWRQVIRPVGADSSAATSVKEVMLLANDPNRKIGVAPTSFWRPFARLGWNWDAGWIWTYLFFYVPAMFLTRWWLRVA